MKIENVQLLKTPYLLDTDTFIDNFCRYADGPVEVRPLYVVEKNDGQVAIAMLNEDETEIKHYCAWIESCHLELYSWERHKELQEEIDEYYADNYADADGEPHWDYGDYED